MLISSCTHPHHDKHVLHLLIPAIIYPTYIWKTSISQKAVSLCDASEETPRH